jgi:hypothetical protein
MLVWTFILERTVVVCLPSIHPKTDLQSRGAVLAMLLPASLLIAVALCLCG